MITLALLVSTFTPAPCESPCYVLVFGGFAERWRPNTAHTWATFARVTPQGLEQFTISWLPQRLPVRPLRITPEPGRNYSLFETLDLFNTGRQKVGLWGPWQIQPQWYAQAAEQKQFLDTGAVQFITLDRAPFRPTAPLRRPDLSHCVHAITRTNEELMRTSRPVLSVGELVTRKVAERMNEAHLLIQPETTHDWLIAALGIQGYPLTRHHLGEGAITNRR